MIPLWIFLAVWLGLLVIYAIMAGLSVIQMMRYGVAGPGTFGVTFIFLALVGITLIASGIYFLSVDWQQTITLFNGALNATPNLPL